MKIEQIVPSRHSKRCCGILLEDGTMLTVSIKTVKTFVLEVDKALDDTSLKAVMLESEKLMKEKMLFMLARRPYAKGELVDALLRKGANREQADDLVQWASEQRWIDEEDYARRIIEQCERKGYGVHRIKAELSRKQVPKELWEDLLSEWTVDEDEIDRLLEKHLKSTDEKGYQKAGQALARRGYSYADIANAIRRNKERYDG